jgi:type IV pilus secretin PilQ/predicted competence protein
MRKTERDAGWGAVGLLGILLLGFLGCTKVLEHQVTPASPEADAASSTVASRGFLSDFPTEQPGGNDAPAAAAQPPALEHAHDALEPKLRVHEIQLANRGGRQAIIVVLSRPPERVRSFVLHDPNRVVLDLEGPLVTTAPRTHAVADPVVARVRLAATDSRLRIVVDVKGAAPDVATERDGRVVVALLGTTPAGSKDQLVYRAPGLAPASLVAESDDPPAEPETLASEPADALLEPVTLTASADDTIAAAPGDTAATAAAIESAPSVPPSDDVTASAATAPLDPAADAPPALELATAPGTQTADAIPVAAAEPPPAVAVAAADAPRVMTATTDLSPRASAHASDDFDSPSADSMGDLDDRAPAKDDLVLHDPPLERPATYALAAQAKPESRKPTTKTRTIEGGTVEQLGASAPGARQYTGQRISLDFKDADIQNVLRILADVSGFNIITTEEVQGKLTMRLVDVPWDQAFDAILRAKNLDSVREGNIMRVSTVDQLKKERDALRAAEEAQKQVEPLEVKYIKVNYAKADEKLVKKVQEVLTERGTTTWDERTNMVVVRDIARGVAAAAELVRQFDTQTPQILIESNIVEAQKSFLRDLGIQWGVANKAGPGTGNSTGLNFPGTINSGGVLAGGKNSPASATLPFIADFPAASVGPGAGSAFDILLGSIDGSMSLDARLTALENDGKVKIISRPRVVTLNNLPATIESLRILRVRLPSTGTVISTGAGGAAGSAQTATEKINTGITLTVTPQVSSDGFIFLDVFAKSSTLAPTSSPDNIPDEVSRQAESHVLIKDGETFVLGGVYQETLNRSDSGIPYLRSIPVLGWAFRNHNDKDERQELLVFITPKTVVGRGGAEALAELPSAANLWQNRAH